MILIDNNNIKFNRNTSYFFKLNKNLKNYKYIIFCYTFEQQNNIIKNLINLKKIDYYFLKNLKSINYLSILYQYLFNTLTLYCTNDLDNLFILLNEFKNSILFCKIENNYYSANSIYSFLTSKNDLLNYLNIYYYNFIIILSKLQKK